MKKKTQKYLLCILSYLYLFVGFSYIIYYISYNIRITNKPLGWVLMIFYALLFFAVYIAVNHIFIRRVISNRLLLLIEALLFVAMLTLVVSDWMYDYYLHLQYIQKTMTAMAAP